MPGIRRRGALVVERLTTGPNAHGYGRLADGRGFAFRIRNRKARLEIYRQDSDAAEPTPDDIELVAERQTGRTNLESGLSLLTLLPALAAEARPALEAPEHTLRAYFGHLDSVMQEWADAVADADDTPQRDRSLRGYLHRLFTNAA